jgi:methyl-accepting chemotaxis protein
MLAPLGWALTSCATLAIGFFLGKKSVAAPSPPDLSPPVLEEQQDEAAEILESPETISPISQQAKERMSEISAQLSEELSRVGSNVSRGKELLRSAATDLAVNFDATNDMVQEQRRAIAGLLENLINSGPTPVEYSLRKINADVASTAENLSGFARLVIQSAKLNMDVHFDVEDVAEDLSRIDELVNGVEWIAKQTHLLALNASIEAAQVGAAGRGFQVVAGEIRSLAHRSKQISDGIRSSAASAKMRVGRAQVASSRSASQDLSVLLDSKLYLDKIRERMILLNEEILLLMAEVSHISRTIGDRTGDAIRCLQFEDIVRQILDHVDYELKSLTQALSRSADLSLESTQNDLLSIYQSILKEERRNELHLPQQEALVASEVELF